MKKIYLATAFIFTLVLSAFSVSAQTQSRDDVIKQIEAKRAELAVLEQKVLAVADSDREEFAAFLSQPQTGIIRLLPRETYDGNAKRALAIRGGGAYYSFVRKTHEYGYGSDIELAQEQLSAGFAGADYGMLLNLGDVPLEQVANDHAATRALLDYTPPVKEPEVRAVQRKLWQGIELSGITFKDRILAKVSNTYLLRSISVDRSDILVVFRVVRQDTDGSLIIVYRVLKTFPKPTMERTPITEGN
ncbi:MAG TPA: hypothetical protein VFT44_09555 [Pyrinomonadaceae bacterium]|nr:hypothetical protein [Pyrinomonadaceae bacterium]HEU4873334.1 hypothetical protein [Pyrinomonadaceae bacterium]